jgi:hypothetical protein
MHGSVSITTLNDVPYMWFVQKIKREPFLRRELLADILLGGENCGRRQRLRTPVHSRAGF